MDKFLTIITNNYAQFDSTYIFEFYLGFDFSKPKYLKKLEIRFRIKKST